MYWCLIFILSLFIVTTDTIKNQIILIKILKILTKDNLLAIDCKHVLRAVSVLTFGSFTLYNYNFTIISFFKRFKKTV